MLTVITTSNVNRRLITAYMSGNQDFTNLGPDFNLSHRFVRHKNQLEVYVTKEYQGLKPKIRITCHSDDKRVVRDYNNIISRINQTIAQAIVERRQTKRKYK